MIRVLDLFCGAGGCSVGYMRGFAAAGLDVEIVGVDNRPQPNYPYVFVQADAMSFPLDGFDFIHASPPCQHYSTATAWRGNRDDHPDLVDATRERLEASGVPWVIENVPGAPVRADYLLCGSAFGLNVRRHRMFETSWRGFSMSPPCRHSGLLPFEHKNERAYADALGCDWMTVQEGRQAIPTAYTAFLASQIAPALTEDAA